MTPRERAQRALLPFPALRADVIQFLEDRIAGEIEGALIEETAVKVDSISMQIRVNLMQRLGSETLFQTINLGGDDDD
jgi:hypothetical protein